MKRASSRVFGSRRRHTRLQTVRNSKVPPPSSKKPPSPWACPPLELPISGRAAPLTVVNEYAALLASGIAPDAADALMVGARHGIWARVTERDEDSETASCVRRADMEFYSLDTGPWTGGNVWESGELLARLFSAPNGSWSHKLANAKAIDLGCGTGVAGLAAASQGACVTLTDRVLACAQHNRDVNFATHEWWRCRLSRLSWGDLETAKRLRLTRGPFDFVFTADTLYNSEDQEALAATVDALADGAHTQVIIGSPNSGDVFFPIAQVRHGFHISDISDEPEVKAAFQATTGGDKQAARHPSRRRVKIYHMQRQ